MRFYLILRMKKKRINLLTYNSFPFLKMYICKKSLKIGFHPAINQGNTDRKFYAFCRN